MGLATTNILKSLNEKDKGAKKMTSEQLRMLQKTLLEMMDDFDKVCKKNKISYMLGGGSCLGAVRHKGFIPWDDDMDLNISRNDFEKLKRCYNHSLSQKYWLHYPEKKQNYGLSTSSLRKKGTIYRSVSDLCKNDEDGIFIDLCIIENTYDNAIMRNIHGFLSISLGLIVSCRRFFKYRKAFMRMASSDKKAKRVFRTKIFLGALVAWLPTNSWARLWNKVNKMCKNNKSKYVVIPTGRKHFFGELYERKVLCDYVYRPFEKISLPITKASDIYLTQLYGADYMVVPPKNKRESHIFLELSFGQ